MSRDLILEVGTEELPSTPLYAALEQLKSDAERALDEARLSYSELETFGSPRRIILSVRELSDSQADRTVRHKGPATRAAFDAEGSPTQAAAGFARGKGVDVQDLLSVEDGSGAYVYAIVEEKGAQAADLLPELLEGLVAALAWPKSMRWGVGSARFSRPVRWLLALLDDEVLPVRFAGLVADRVTYGHRFLSPGRIEVPDAASHEAALISAFVQPHQTRRARSIQQGIERAMRETGNEAVVPEKTFAEVVNLVEWPTVAVGTFDEGFLRVPREVLENAMEGHQRYFPVQEPSSDGRACALTNRFVVVHNGDPARSEEIVRGHERVIRARLADAAFFYDEDLASPLESYVSRLDTIVFQDKLGSLGEKSRRIERLAGELAALAGAPADETAFATRAAHLAKADLVTNVVVEFPTLQGVMGGYYAEAAGEERAVAKAVVDHYRPRFAGDGLPTTLAGRLVAIADKLDTIVGMYAAGMPPTGSADPYGLRRGSIGILQMILDGVPLTLNAALSAALDGFESRLPQMDREAVARDVSDFIRGRFEVLLRDRDVAYDTVAAVLMVAGDDPADALARSLALQAARDSDPETFEDLSVAFTRAKNLSEPSLGTATTRPIMGAEEAALLDAIESAEAAVTELIGDRSYPQLLEQYAALRIPVDDFFEKVLVMDPDEALRSNRLRLLNRFVALFAQFADFSAISS